MKFTLFLSLLLATSSFALTKTFPSGEGTPHFYGTISTLGSRLYSISAPFELRFTAICYPGSIQARVPGRTADKRQLLPIDINEPYYYYCPENAPHLGLVFGGLVSQNVTVIINEFPVTNASRSNNITAPMDSDWSVFRFPTPDGFLWDNLQEYVRYLGIDYSQGKYAVQRESDGTLLVYASAGLAINPTNNNTRILEDGEYVSLSRNPSFVCGKLPTNMSGYEFEADPDRKYYTRFQSGDIIQYGNQVLVCRSLPPVNVTFRIVAPIAVSSFYSFNCTAIRYNTGQSLWALIPKPANRVQAIFITDPDRISGFPAYEETLLSVCVYGSEAYVTNITVSQPQLKDSITLTTSNITQEVFNTVLSPYQVNLHIVTATELGYFYFSELPPYASITIGSDGEQSSLSSPENVFSPNEGILAYFNPQSSDIVVNATAYRVYGPAMTVDDQESFPDNSGLVTYGPLVVIPPSDLCINITSNTEWQLGIDGYYRVGSIVCRSPISSKTYFGVGVSLGQVSATRPSQTSLTLGVPTLQNPNSGAQIFTIPSPTNQSEDNILAFDYPRRDWFSPLDVIMDSYTISDRAWVNFFSTKEVTNSLFYNFVAGKVSEPTNITVNYITVSPSCESNSDCLNSDCNNGICGACNQGFQGYGCTIPIPVSSPSTNPPQSNASGISSPNTLPTTTNVKPSSASVLCCSMLLLIALLI